MKILVYDDSLDFGGHQSMACHGIKALTQDPAVEIITLTDAQNVRLKKELSDIPRLKAVQIPRTDGTRPAILPGIDHRETRRLAKFFMAEDPDVVLCIQGDTEQSAHGVLAAEAAGMKCISYLALPHTKSTMGARLATVRDLWNRTLLNRPDHYITISGGMKSLLQKRGVRVPIDVVPNGIERQPPPDRAGNAYSPAIGLIGRIEFKQKRQDFMVEAFCSYPHVFRNHRLIIAGDGPDKGRLLRQIAACSRTEDITILPWTDNIDSLYAQLGLLVIPSRYEGVPLVMLEALARGIPVLGSACDGMKDILPESWLFSAGNADSMIQAIEELQRSGYSEIDGVSEKIRTEMTLEKFRENFQRAVTQA